MYDGIVLHVGILSALISLFALSRAPPEQKLLNWIHTISTPNAIFISLTTIAGISLTSLGLTATLYPLPTTEPIALLSSFLWAGVTTFIGRVTLHGARDLADIRHSNDTGTDAEPELRTDTP